MYYMTSFYFDQKIFLEHLNTEELYKFLKEDNGLIIIHGHSHSAEGFISLRENKHVFNPGSCLDGHYGIIEFQKSKEGKWRIHKSTIGYL